MSSQMPGAYGSEPQRGAGPEVEHLESGAARPVSRRGRRWGIAAAATVGVLGVAGASAWGVGALMGGGPGAAQGVPADALFYLSLDLDPDAGQKVEAYQFLRKFPALDGRLGDGEDLRRSLVEAILTEAPCDDLDFATDFDPWLGDRVAVAVRPGGEEPVPFVVMQVKDEAKAREGVDKIAACDGEDVEPPGLAFTGEHMILAEDAATAKEIAADAGAESLADDDGFTRWVDEAGGSGIVTAYVSAEAPSAMMDYAEDQDAVSTEGDSGSGGAAALQEQMAKTFDEFEGAAMVLRFEDEGVVLEAAASAAGSEGLTGEGGDSGLVDLPATTAAAFGLGVGDDAVDRLFTQLSDAVGAEEFEELVAEAESETGLTLPEDLQAMLGDGMSFALDSSIDPAGLEGSTPGEMDVPAGVRIVGDPGEVVAPLEKLIEAAGLTGEVVIERGDGVVAVGITEDYVAELAGEGDLGEQDGFRKALPDVDETVGGLFVDFDADDWLTRLIQSEGEAPEVVENIEPLDSLGITGTLDGDVARGWVRLSTD